MYSLSFDDIRRGDTWLKERWPGYPNAEACWRATRGRAETTWLNFSSLALCSGTAGCPIRRPLFHSDKILVSLQQRGGASGFLPTLTYSKDNIGLGIKQIIMLAKGPLLPCAIPASF